MSRFQTTKRIDPVAISGVLQGAATQITTQSETKGATPVIPAQQWQSRALGYYHMLGECRNPAQFVSTAMSKIRFHVAIRDEQGQIEEVEANDAPDVAALVKQFDRLAARYGLLMWLVGECRICQFRDSDDAADDPVRWDAFSPTEVKLSDRNRTITRTPMGGGQALRYDNISDVEDAGEPKPGQMRTWRFWIPDAEFSDLADSPVRPVLDLYEQLWWLTMSERADLQSRIADNGILLVPVELDWKPPEGADAEATEEDAEQGTLMDYLGEGMSTAIGDPGSAAAAVPLAIEGAGDRLDQIRILHTHEGSQSLVFVSQREQSIVTRIAQNLPIPVETVVGMSQANHWTAWKIEDEKWQLTEPWVTGFAEDVTRVVLQPFLDANSLPDDLIVWYDYSALVSDPDRGATAITLHKEGLLKGIEALNANGFPGDAMMDGEELDWWRALQLKDASIATGEAPAAAPTTGDPAEQPPAEPDATPEGDTPPTEAQALTELRRQALQFADQRARQTIGASLRGRKRSCPDCLKGLEGVENAALLQHLDAERLERLGIRETKVVEQLTAQFASVAHELGYDASPHLAAVASWYMLTLREPEGLPDDLVDRIRYSGGVAQ